MENRGYSNATNAVLYKAVKVLMLSWKDSAQKEFKQQLQRLSTEFKAHNFDVEEYDIESKRSHLRLSLRLSEFLNYDDDDTLLIIYYSGHGQDDQDKNNLWLRYELENGQNKTKNLITLFEAMTQAQHCFRRTRTLIGARSRISF